MSSLVDRSIDQQEIQSTLKLLIAPENCAIQTVPLPAIQVMFGRANCLLQKQGLIDGSAIYPF